MSSLRGVMVLSLLRWSVFTYNNKRYKVLSKTDDHIYQHCKDSKDVGKQAFLNNIIVYLDLYIVLYIYLNWRNKSIIDVYVNILGGDFTYYPYYWLFISNYMYTKFFHWLLFLSACKLYKKSLIYYLPRLKCTDPLILAPLQPPLRR